MTAIKRANAIYTGGNIWLFHGLLEDGNHFFTDDYGCTIILNADPSENLDDACDYNWQHEHLVRELDGEEREQFCKDMLSLMKTYPYGSEENGGITEAEINGYMDYMMGEM